MMDMPKENAKQAGQRPGKGGDVVDASARTRPRIHSAGPTEAKINVKDLEFLGDVPLKLNIVLGQAMMSLGEVIALENDSIVQLDKASGEPIDIYVEDQRLGSGEVLVLHEKIRIRLLEVASPTVEEHKRHPSP